MKIFINAATLRVGGGRSVGVNFLATLSKIKTDHTFYAVVPDDEKYLKVLAGSAIEYIAVPSSFHSPFKRLSLDKWIVEKVENYEPDVVYSMGNIALPLADIKQVVLFHFPYAIYPENPVWKRLNWKDYLRFKLVTYLFGQRLKFANRLIAQTQTAKKRIVDLYNFDKEKITIVPNAVSLDSINENVQEGTTIEGLPIVHGGCRLVCLSYYYPHKNLEVFLEVGKQLEERGLPVQIITTINRGQDKEAVAFLDEIENRNLQNTIVNIGAVPMEKVPYLYQHTDGLLLPTLLESFSGTYVEAMFFKRAVLTSNYDFARDVCGEYGIYFDPLSSEDITNKIEFYLNLTEEDRAKIDRLRIEKLAEFRNWTECSEMMLNELLLSNE